MTSRPWLRLYRSVANSPKIQRLRPEAFKAWVNCLCLTDDAGNLPDIADLAFALRMSEDKTKAILSHLADSGLFETLQDGTLVAHDWAEHQRDSDVSNDRVRRYRERERNVTGNEAVSVQSKRREDTEKRREEGEGSQARPAPLIAPTPSEPVVLKPRAQRWPPDAVVPGDWIEAGTVARQEHGLAAIDLKLEAVQFQNYWASKSGGNAARLDWRKTWINWCLKAYANGRTGSQGSKTGHPLGIFGDVLEAARTGSGNGPGQR